MATLKERQKEIGMIDVDTVDYIRKYYNVPARIGGRIRYMEKHEGIIAGVDGGYLMIVLDGEPVGNYFHPTGEIEYLD